jgi:hypothetical protein
MLCPICSQKLRDFIAIEEGAMSAAALRRGLEAEFEPPTLQEGQTEGSLLA